MRIKVGNEDVVKDNYKLDYEDDEEKDKDNGDGMIIICERLTCVLILTKVPRD